MSYLLRSDPYSRIHPEPPPPLPSTDHFNLLPDSLLLLIFDLLSDVKDLGRLTTISRRFHSLIPLVQNILVRVDCVISDDIPSLNSDPSAFSSLFRLISKPFLALGQFLGPKRNHPLTTTTHHSPTQVLKNFESIRFLKIELPTGELGIDDGVLLKWRASFGSTLDHCIILGASSVTSSLNLNSVENSVGYSNLNSQQNPVGNSNLNSQQNPVENSNSVGNSVGNSNLNSQQNSVGNSNSVENFVGSLNSILNSNDDEESDDGNIPESFYTNGGLKLRVVWTISSLIAASARHYLLQPIIAEHTGLDRLVLSDADGQGELCMDREQLEELRVTPLSASSASKRTLVPALNMRLWYAPVLELGDGSVLSGATLVAIRPSESKKEVCDGDWLSNAFEEPFGTAAKLLIKRRTYCLEMNSF